MDDWMRSALLALAVAVVTLLSYNFLFVQPRVAKLEKRVVEMQTAHDKAKGELVTIQKDVVHLREGLRSTRAIALDNADATESLAIAHDSLVGTVNYNANISNMNHSGY